MINISLVVMEGKYGAIHTDYSSFHGYFIINFSSYLYTLQADLSIDGQVILSGESFCEGTHFLSININSHYYIYKIKFINKNVSLRKIINGNVKFICYNSKDVVPLCLSPIL